LDAFRALAAPSARGLRARSTTTLTFDDHDANLAMSLRTVLHLLVLSTGILAAVRGPVQATEKERPLRYARVAADGAWISNLPDDKGREIARPKRGELVAVFKDGATGWLEVEVPGGFAVWVFGRYLEPTDEAGLYRVTGNAVNLRPAPTSDVTSFPLPQRLQTDDKVRVIEVLEPEKPLAETWVRLWSPPGVRGYLKSAAVEGLTPAEDGPALWAQAVAARPSTPPIRATQPELKTPSEAELRETEARTALDEAKAALERERQRETPDYDGVQAALDAVVARGGAAAIEARAELRTLAMLREAATFKAELERERQRHAAEALAEQKRVWERSQEKDPLGGAFATRGVVERRTGADGIPRFFLSFGSGPVCELTCPSGRYDLSTYNGVEVGVHGSAVTSRTGELPTYEVARLEVLAVR
jgi:hypothetical protein